MKLIRFFLAVAVIAVMFISVACEYVFIEPVTYTVSGEVKFSTDVAPVLNRECITCHNGNHSSGLDLRTDYSYASLQANNCVTAPAATSILIVHINADHHSDGITGEENAKMVSWIDAAAPNN